MFYRCLRAPINGRYFGKDSENINIIIKNRWTLRTVATRPGRTEISSRPGPKIRRDRDRKFDAFGRYLRLYFLTGKNALLRIPERFISAKADFYPKECERKPRGVIDGKPRRAEP